MNSCPKATFRDSLIKSSRNVSRSSRVSSPLIRSCRPPPPRKTIFVFCGSTHPCSHQPRQETGRASQQSSSYPCVGSGSCSHARRRSPSSIRSAALSVGRFVTRARWRSSFRRRRKAIRERASRRSGQSCGSRSMRFFHANETAHSLISAAG